MKDLKFGILNEIYGSQLSSKQNEIIKAYYDFDLSITEIAENNNTTRQAVCDAVKKGEQALERLEKDMGFYEKQMMLKSSVEEINKLLEDGDVDKAKEVVRSVYSQF